MKEIVDRDEDSQKEKFGKEKKQQIILKKIGEDYKVQLVDSIPER